MESEERNKSFHVLTMERELIVKYYDFDYKKQPENFKNATEVMKELFEQSNGLRVNQIQTGKALRSLQCPTGRDHLQRSGYFLKLKNSTLPF